MSAQHSEPTIEPSAIDGNDALFPHMVIDLRMGNSTDDEVLHWCGVVRLFWENLPVQHLIRITRIDGLDTPRCSSSSSRRSYASFSSSGSRRHSPSPTTSPLPSPPASLVLSRSPTPPGSPTSDCASDCGSNSSDASSVFEPLNETHHTYHRFYPYIHLHRSDYHKLHTTEQFDTLIEENQKHIEWYTRLYTDMLLVIMNLGNTEEDAIKKDYLHCCVTEVKALVENNRSHLEAVKALREATLAS